MGASAVERRRGAGSVYAVTMRMRTTAKLFVNGRSQAVRIPKDYQEGDTLVIAPVRKSWTSYADDAPLVDDDFLVDRPRLMDSGRRRVSP